MKNDDYTHAKALIEEIGGDFDGEKAEDLVVLAENALGVSFPPSYRSFLRDYGCGGFDGFEVYGLIDENFVDSSVPNGIWLTLNERGGIGLEKKFVIVGSGGDGTYLALDTGSCDSNGEAPVVRLSVEGEKFEIVAPSFGRYLLSAVQSLTN